MAEYVNVDKITSYIKGYAKRSIDLGSFDLVDDILTICENIKKMSVDNVVEVKHGKWKMEVDEYRICATVFTCSNCKATYTTVEMDDKEFLEDMKYCPTCGAKMEGVEE